MRADFIRPRSEASTARVLGFGFRVEGFGFRVCCDVAQKLRRLGCRVAAKVSEILQGQLGPDCGGPSNTLFPARNPAEA